MAVRTSETLPAAPAEGAKMATASAEEQHHADGSALAATTRPSELPELKQSEALLVVFDLAVKPGHAGREQDLAQRVMLESVAYGAQEIDCRVLGSFSSRRWRRRLYESLAHLHQSGYISCSMLGYDLTDKGRARAEGFPLAEAERERLRATIANASSATA